MAPHFGRTCFEITFDDKLHPTCRHSRAHDCDCYPMRKSLARVILTCCYWLLPWYFPRTQTFVTQEDNELDAEIQADLDDSSFEFLNDSTSISNPFEIENTPKEVTGKNIWTLDGDDDTTSTMVDSRTSVSFGEVNQKSFVHEVQVEVQEKPRRNKK